MTYYDLSFWVQTILPLITLLSRVQYASHKYDFFLLKFAKLIVKVEKTNNTKNKNDKDEQIYKKHILFGCL